MARQTKVILCPYCGFTQKPCSRCTACGGLFDVFSQVATQVSMGPWFIRDKSKPFRPGCSYEALTKLIKAGRVKPKSILRGPTTRQFWSLARNIPGVAHLVGYCHACGAHVTPDKVACPECAEMFMAVEERDEMGLRFPTDEIAQAANQALQQKLAQRNNQNEASGISVYDADSGGRAPVFRNGVLFDPPAGQTGEYAATGEPDDLDEFLDAQSDLGLDATGTHIAEHALSDETDADPMEEFVDEQGATDEPEEAYEPSEATLVAAELEGLTEVQDEEPATPKDRRPRAAAPVEPDVLEEPDEVYEPSEATLAAAQLEGLGGAQDHGGIEIEIDSHDAVDLPDTQPISRVTEEAPVHAGHVEPYQPSEATLMAAELEGLVDINDSTGTVEVIPDPRAQRPETPAATSPIPKQEAREDEEMDEFELGPELVLDDADGSSMAPCPGDSPIAGLEMPMSDEDPLDAFGERAKQAIAGSGKPKKKRKSKSGTQAAKSSPAPASTPTPRRVEGVMMLLLVTVTVCGMGLMVLFVTSSGFGPKQATAASPDTSAVYDDTSAIEIDSGSTAPVEPFAE